MKEAELRHKILRIPAQLFGLVCTFGGNVNSSVKRKVHDEKYQKLSWQSIDGDEVCGVTGMRRSYDRRIG